MTFFFFWIFEFIYTYTRICLSYKRFVFWEETLFLICKGARMQVTRLRQHSCSTESNLNAPDALVIFWRGVWLSLWDRAESWWITQKGLSEFNQSTAEFCWEYCEFVMWQKKRVNLVTWEPSLHKWKNTLHWHFPVFLIWCASLVLLNHVVLVLTSLLHYTPPHVQCTTSH